MVFLQVETTLFASLIQAGAWGILVAILLYLHIRRDKEEKEQQLQHEVDRKLLIAKIEKSDQECELRYQQLKQEFDVHKQEEKEYKRSDQKEMYQSMNKVAEALRELINQNKDAKS